MNEKLPIVEFEYSEDDILYYLVDEDDNEVGFVIEENGCEVECYYEEFEGTEYELVQESSTNETKQTAASYIPERAENHGYLHKLATIAGYESDKARAKAEVKLDKVRSKAETHAGKAKEIVTEQASKAKSAAGNAGFRLTRDEMKETTADLNAIAKEGAETAKELKEAYNDIMENVGFLMPRKIRRRLP